MARKNRNLKNEEDRDMALGAIQASEKCSHSIGIKPYLVNDEYEVYKTHTSTDRLSKLKRLYKKEFGFKPAGKTEEQIEDELKSRLMKKYGYTYNMKELL